MNKSFRRGFTLLELAIVIMVGGLIMSQLLNLMSSVSTSNQSLGNATKMDNVDAAIKEFFRKNNRMPCPADPTLTSASPNYGNEAINASTGLCGDYSFTIRGSVTNPLFKNHTIAWRNASNAVQTSVNHSLVWGTIPFKTLGLTESEMYDAYRNKITYITAQGYASNLANVNTSMPFYRSIAGWTRVALPSRLYRESAGCSAAIITTTATSANDNFCTERIASSCQSATTSNPLIVTTLVAEGVYPQNASNVFSGDAIINTCRMDVVNYSNQYVKRENLAYAIISHGSNGYGAWNASGGLNALPTSLPEKKNSFEYYHTLYPAHDLTLSTNAITLVSDKNATDFDDIVIYHTVDDLLVYSKRQDSVYCHQSTVFMDVAAGSAKDTNCFVWGSDLSMMTNTITATVKMNRSGAACGTGTTRRLSCSAGGLWVNPV